MSLDQYSSSLLANADYAASSGRSRDISESSLVWNKFEQPSRIEP